MQPKAVIFDIGNVLIEWQPERYYDRVIGADRRQAMFAEVDLHGMNDRVDLGGHFTETIYATAEEYPEWRTEIRMWHDHWIELASPAIDHSVRLKSALRAKGIPVFSLTNFGIQDVTIKRFEATVDDSLWDTRSLHFHATWFELRNIQTKTRRDLNYVTVRGAGRYVGTSITIFNTCTLPNNQTWWG